MDRTRGLMVASGGAHSSVASAARAMDADVVARAADPQGRLHGGGPRGDARRAGVRRPRAPVRHRRHGGTTNAGVVDDLAATAAACAVLDTWMHVDGAYGGAALAAPSARHQFAGIEAADSFIVDPHKWLFAPFDSCALLYRDPEIGRRAHTQHAEYLDVLHADHGDGDGPEWNASDYAHHLSRRARGLPLWFSLATHGTDAYAEAIETTLRVAREGAALVALRAHLELLVEPELSIVLFRRVGWDCRHVPGVERRAAGRPSSRS